MTFWQEVGQSWGETKAVEETKKASAKVEPTEPPNTLLCQKDFFEHLFEHNLFFCFVCKYCIAVRKRNVRGVKVICCGPINGPALPPDGG